MQAQLGVFLHGLTRNKEIVSLLHTFGLSISYRDTLDLEAAWAAEDIEKVSSSHNLN